MGPCYAALVSRDETILKDIHDGDTMLRDHGAQSSDGVDPRGIPPPFLARNAVIGCVATLHFETERAAGTIKRELSPGASCWRDSPPRHLQDWLGRGLRAYPRASPTQSKVRPPEPARHVAW